MSIRKFVRQENLKDCGAACLLMIIKQYGGNYPLEQLRDMLKTDKNGTTALSIIETAKRIGFEARGYRVEEYEHLECPSIAHIIIDKTYHHFVVVEKVDQKKQIIHVADPALGLKKYSFDEFNQIWTRVIITFYPTRKIDNINVIENVRKTMSQLINPYKKLFIVIFLLSIIYTILNILNTFYFKIIIDHTMATFKISFYLFLLFLFLTLTKIIIDYIRSRLLTSIERSIEKQLMSNTFGHLLELPWQYFNSRSTGDIISRLNDLNYVKELISRGCIILLIDLVLVVGAIIVMCYINYFLFLITILICIVYFAVVYGFNHSIKYFVMRNQEEEALLSSTLVENIKGINTVKNLGIETQIYEKTMKKYSSFIDNNYNFNNKYNFARMLKDFVLSIGILTIIFIGGLFISKGTLSISDFIIFNFFVSFFFEPLKNIFDFEPLFRAASSALVRTSEFFNIEKDKHDGLLKVPSGNLKFNKVKYSYNGVKEVMNNINIEVKAGSKVMISGPSGSGKSTLFKMLMRYLDVGTNQIIIDNEDILSYSRDTLRKSISYVSQDETLFTGFLYDNVVLNRNISEEQMNSILSITCIDDILLRHNRDYYMLLEEDASNLSGGERQRIMIARALLKDSNIYIFDESMSEMNVTLERKILNNIFMSYRDKTIIVISHRLDNADLYDKIIMVGNELKEGV